MWFPRGAVSKATRFDADAGFARVGRSVVERIAPTETRRGAERAPAYSDEGVRGGEA